MRHFTRSSLTWESFTGNRVVLWGSVILIGLQLAVTYAPPLQQVFGTTPLDAKSWAVIIALGVAKFFAVTVEKSFWRMRGVLRM